MAPLATVGILSIGDMGVGIARLLVAHGYRVVTNVEGRSEYTAERCRGAGVEMLQSDDELVKQSDYILSIVPPASSLDTATRIRTALERTARPSPHPLYFIDLNAISPASAQRWAATFTALSKAGTVRILDGGIIGGPPFHTPPSSAHEPGKPTPAPAPRTTTSVNPDRAVQPGTAEGTVDSSWTLPSIPISGAWPLPEAPLSGAHLAAVLNSLHIAPTIGPATGLKMCFAAVNKGFVAVATQAMASAAGLGVLPEMKAHLEAYSPALARVVEWGVPGMCPKAWRWVGEMREIGGTFRGEGWEGAWGERDGGGKEEGRVKAGDLFEAVADLYRVIAEESVLGKERVGARERGTTAGEVAEVLAKELGGRKKEGGG